MMALVAVSSKLPHNKASLGDLGILAHFAWFIGGCIYGAVQVVREQGGIKIEVTKVGKGLAAIASWLALYFFSTFQLAQLNLNVGY